MTIAAVIQARMSSQRLPGKVLLPLAGRPLLTWLLERVRRCRQLDGIVIATSDQLDDDPIAGFCAAHGILCHRGDLRDVAGRFLGVLNKYQFDAVVRLCADSPLLDPAIIDEGVRIMRDQHPDLVTNLHPRTYPPGMSMEVIGAEAFRRACSRMRTAAEQEHVTPYFYSHADQFRIFNLAAKRDYGDVRFTVDTPEDLHRIERLITVMNRPHWQYGLDDLISLADL